MTRRTLAVALIVLGAIAVLAAIASATIWRPTDTATLSLPSRPETPVVVSDAGVLDAVGPDVTIRATAGGEEPVVLAVGRTADVDAWVGTAAHTRITGLESWEQLKVSDVAAGGTEEPTEGATAEPAEPAALPNPAGSDLWVAQETGTGNARLTWTDRDGRWSLLAATDGTAPAPDVTLTWSVEVRTPWLVPGLILGGLLMIAGIALLVLQVLADREAARRPVPVGAADDETEVLPAAAGAGLTRRELRERERAEARRRGRGRTGEIPVVATTGEIPVVATTGEMPATSTHGVADAGAARGAGIVPASARAEELRAAREPDTGTETSEEPETSTEPEHDTGAPTAAHPLATDDIATAGVARGAGVVPASDRAADLRAGRDDAEASADTGLPGGEDRPVGAAASGATAAPSERAPDEEAARWTEGETGDETAAMPVVGSEETAAMPVVGSEETAAMPVVGSEETAAMPVVGPAEEHTAAEEPTIAEEQEQEQEQGEQPDDRQGWRSLWGFGRRRPDDEGEEQR